MQLEKCKQTSAIRIQQRVQVPAATCAHFPIWILIFAAFAEYCSKAEEPRVHVMMEILYQSLPFLWPKSRWKQNWCPLLSCRCRSRHPRAARRWWALVAARGAIRKERKSNRTCLRIAVRRHTKVEMKQSYQNSTRQEAQFSKESLPALGRKGCIGHKGHWKKTRQAGKRWRRTLS